jgi:hypothetical protein
MVINMSESDWISRSDSFMTLASICLSRGLLVQQLRRPVLRGATAFFV